MNNRPHRGTSLQVKVLITATVALMLLAAMLVYFYGREMERAANNALGKRAAAIATGLANGCEYGLLAGNKSLLQQAVVKVLAQSDVVAAIVFDDNGKLMAAAGLTTVTSRDRDGRKLVQQYKQPVFVGSSRAAEGERIAQYYLPVLLLPASMTLGTEADGPASEAGREIGQQLGLVELAVSSASTDLAVQQAQRTALLITAFCALVVSLLCVLGVRRMIEPLRTLAAGTQELAGGNLNVRVAAKTSDELGDLAYAFNEMAESLQRSQREVLDYQRNLEQRVKERTIELEKEITERKKAEEALRQSEERFKQVAENAGEWIWEVDADGVYRYSSSAVGRVLGYSPDELVGKMHFYDLFAPEVREQMKAATLAAFRRKEPFRDFVNPNVHKDGRIVILETTGSPIQDENGALLGYRGADTDITERKRAEADLEDLHKQLVDSSRQAGMAEMATTVLHNVGNVLNSLNISFALVSDKVRKSKLPNLAKAAALLQEHKDDLAAFLSSDPKGGQLPGYLINLAQHLTEEHAQILQELKSLIGNVEHIKEITAAQQNCYKVSGAVEPLPVVELVEDALRMNAATLSHHDVQVVREYSETPPVVVDKHKALQILVNLIRNAQQALDGNRRRDKRLTLRVAKNGSDFVHVSVIDNGVGIPPENLARIFEHGFTTRKDGHGFGLHSSALAAQDLGGMLTVHSEGRGKGAAFTLALPCQPMEGAREDQKPGSSRPFTGKTRDVPDR